MSHEIRYATFDEKTDKRKIQDYCDKVAKCEDWQEGCSGVSPIRFLPAQPMTYGEAWDYLKEQDKGGYDCLAVRFRATEGLKWTPSAELLKAKARARELGERLERFQREHDVRNFKAELIGCRLCGSKVARGYLNNSRCPVCGSDLRSESVLAEQGRLNKEYEAVCEKERELTMRDIDKQSKKCPVKWLVKFEFHL